MKQFLVSAKTAFDSFSGFNHSQPVFAIYAKLLSMMLSIKL